MIPVCESTEAAGDDESKDFTIKDKGEGPTRNAAIILSNLLTASKLLACPCVHRSLFKSAGFVPPPGVSLLIFTLEPRERYCLATNISLPQLSTNTDQPRNLHSLLQTFNMRSKFKDEHPFEKRKAEAERIRSKYADRIPVSIHLLASR